MNIVLDTNAYSELVKGSARVAQAMSRAARVVVPFIVLAELRAGFAVGSKRALNEKQLDVFLAKPGVEVMHTNDDTVLVYAAIYAQFRKSGRMIPTNDIWIAALAMQHHLVLCSDDAHFDHLPQILRA